MKTTLSKIAILSLWGFCSIAMAQTSTLPKFTDYPVNIYTGKKAPIDYKSDPLAKIFKTRINESYSKRN